VADLQWEQFTLGQNKVIQDIGAAAAKASALVDANAKLAQTTLETGKVLLMGLLNPQLLLLTAIADEIDAFVEDFKGTGFYILEIVPKDSMVLAEDVNGSPISIMFSPIGLTANYAACAAVGMGDKFLEWFEIISGGETDPNNPQKSGYYIKQGKSEAEEIRTQNANDDSATNIDGVFGFPKQAPSGVISQIVSAMDEEADINRPNFSSSAEVAGVVVIIGFSDLTKNLIPLKNTLQAFIAFFGGENGLFTKGLLQIFNIVKAGADALEKGEDSYKVVIKVENVSGVRGTDEDKKSLNRMGVNYNYEKVFEEGDLVVGPIRMFGGTAGKGRAMGIVTEAETTSNEPRAPYSSQILTLSCLSETDQHAFENLGNGNVIQRVAYYKNHKTYIDQNTGQIIGAEPKVYFNDYVYIQDLPSEIEFVVEGSQEWIEREGERSHVEVLRTRENEQTYVQQAQMKVEKVKGEALLKVKETQDATEYHTFSRSTRRVAGVGDVVTSEGEKFQEKNWYGALDTKTTPSEYITKNEVIGKIVAPKKSKNEGVYPNFKKAKLEDLMDDLKTFFFQISKFTQGMRDFAAGATEELQKVVDYLDEKIAEIEELNKSIQAILAIFQIGIPDAGVYVLSIPTTTGGNEAIKEALTSATNGPPNTLDYSVGFMMMGGGPSMKPLQLLLTGG